MAITEEVVKNLDFYNTLAASLSKNAAIVECKYGNDEAIMATLIGALIRGAGPDIVIVFSNLVLQRKILSRFIFCTNTFVGMQEYTTTKVITKANSTYHFLVHQPNSVEQLQGLSIDFLIYALSK